MALDAARHADRPEVVLADEHHGNVEVCREVGGLVEVALAGGAVAEEGHGHLVRLQQLEAVARTRCLQDAWTDDPARTKHADLRRKEVHASAPSARTARIAPVKLCNQRSRLKPLGESMTVAAVGAENGIRFAQLRTHPGRDGFLADVGVAGPVDQSALMRTCQALLDHPNGQHLPIMRQQLLLLGLNGGNTVFTFHNLFYDA